MASNANFSTSNIAGVAVLTATTDADFELGTATKGTNNRDYLYVQASGTVATGTCTVDGSFQLTDTAGDYTADVAFADNEYGWVRVTAPPTS